MVSAAGNSQQLPLPVTLADYATFDNFVEGSNATAVAALRDIGSEAGHALWLFGPHAVGKTHLLQALCASDTQATYLPAAELARLSPAILEGYERFSRVCIDDVTRLAGDAAWEKALFRLYNALADAGGMTVLASRDNPRAAGLSLPDLASRLRSGQIFHLQPLGDEHIIEALTLRADRRGFELPVDTGRYLITHYRRDLASLCELLDRLDLAVLATRRRITVPFIKDVLAGNLPA